MSVDDIQLYFVELRGAREEATPAGDEGRPQLHTRRSDLHGRTPRQRDYIAAMLDHDITISIGPAGTGKTYLAVAAAVDALERDIVKRIVLTRPAVEAGERLGFLPGDLAQKVDPYLRPLYDALFDLLGFDKTQRLLERQTIEIAPLAYMRGRTLNQAFVILDEAQNTTREQMKMFLTRIGFGSKAVVTGDVTQIDLPRGTTSGLIEAQHVLAEVRGMAFVYFTAADVVRHPLVGRIVEAYEAAEARAEAVAQTELTYLRAVAPDAGSRTDSPGWSQFRGSAGARDAARWIHAALDRDAEIMLRFVDAREGRRLNRVFRRRDYATDVLTFSYAVTPVGLADIVICPAVVRRAARSLRRALRWHSHIWSCMPRCTRRATSMPAGPRRAAWKRARSKCWRRSDTTIPYLI